MIVNRGVAVVGVTDNRGPTVYFSFPHIFFSFLVKFKNFESLQFLNLFEIKYIKWTIITHNKVFEQMFSYLL